MRFRARGSMHAQTHRLWARCVKSTDRDLRSRHPRPPRTSASHKTWWHGDFPVRYVSLPEFIKGFFLGSTSNPVKGWKKPPVLSSRAWPFFSFGDFPALAIFRYMFTPIAYIYIYTHTHTHRIHVWYIYANIWKILMVNVTIYSIHGSYGKYIYIYIVCVYIYICIIPIYETTISILSGLYTMNYTH